MRIKPNYLVVIGIAITIFICGIQYFFTLSPHTVLGLYVLPAIMLTVGTFIRLTSSPDNESVRTIFCSSLSCLD
jgi:hypothetical protein